MIDKELFAELYPDLIDDYSKFANPIPRGTSSEEFVQNYLSSKLWRLNNLYKVVDKSGDLVKFIMNKSQHRVYSASRQHSRIIILKSRQQGISTFWLVSYFDDVIFRPNLNCGLMAQGKDEAATLLERVERLWEELNPDIKEFLGIERDKNNSLELSFTNNSKLYIRVSFRSATLHRLHISEFGKIANENPKRARETKTGTLQAIKPGNTVVIESTAEGENDFKDTWDRSVEQELLKELAPKDFKPVFLSWLDDSDCTLTNKEIADESAEKYFKSLEDKGLTLSNEQRNFWIMQKRELGDDVFQEYPATPEEAFAASKDGTFYHNIYKEFILKQNRLQDGLLDPNLHIDVAFDLGVKDYGVLVFFQYHNNEIRIIKEYINDGYALVHYLEYIDSTNLPIRFVIFPHDISVRELTASDKYGRAKTRETMAMDWMRTNYKDWKVHVMKKYSIEDGINATRQMLKSTYIEKECTYIRSCLQRYTKEWDDKLNTWKKSPRHDEYSHGADCLRIIATSVLSKSGLKNRRPVYLQNVNL